MKPRLKFLERCRFALPVAFLPMWLSTVVPFRLPPRIRRWSTTLLNEVLIAPRPWLFLPFLPMLLWRRNGHLTLPLPEFGRDLRRIWAAPIFP